MYGPKDVEVPAAATPPTSQPLPSRQPDLWTRLPPPLPPPMTIDDACKVLKTTASATWESIEQTTARAIVVTGEDGNSECGETYTGTGGGSAGQ